MTLWEGIKQYRNFIWIVVLASFATILIRFASPTGSNDGRVAGAYDQVETASSEPADIKLALPPAKKNDSTPLISARASYLLDVDSSYPLWAENELEPVPIASVTKIMTAVLVAENYDLAAETTVSENAASAIGSSIHLRTDEHISIESLLKGLLIQSGNDAAMALAEHIGLEEFVSQMNAKAQYLGMAGTTYKDPAGLDDEGRSNARDLAVLAAYALRHQTIRDIATIVEETVSSTDGAITHELKTSNRLLKSDHPLYMPEAIGLKTGFTPDAGHCLVASAEKDGHLLVSVILGTSENTVEASAKESRKLLGWGFENFSWH